MFDSVQGPQRATGQLRQDGGAVLIDGEVVSHPDPLQEAGRCDCSSGTSPYPDLTVYENLFVGRELCNRAGMLKEAGSAADGRPCHTCFRLVYRFPVYD